MKLKELQTILRSDRGSVQFAIVYDSTTNTDLENGCSIDYAVKEYGDKELLRIGAFENLIILTI